MVLVFCHQDSLGKSGVECGVKMLRPLAFSPLSSPFHPCRQYLSHFLRVAGLFNKASMCAGRVLDQSRKRSV
jgi:hypothetical protein